MNHFFTTIINFGKLVYILCNFMRLTHNFFGSTHYWYIANASLHSTLPTI